MEDLIIQVILMDNLAENVFKKYSSWVYWNEPQHNFPKYDWKQRFNIEILEKEGKIYQKSDAALEIARNLDGLWKIFYIFKNFIHIKLMK